MRLESDFTDWYDFAFSKTGPLFRRMSKGGPTRSLVFRWLAAHGYQVPIHGKVSEVFLMKPNLTQEPVYEKRQVVVYLDERAHRGEGKVLLPIRDAYTKHPDSLCSLYCPSYDSHESVSYRLLQIGDRRWWLRYRSFGNWQSNHGEGDIHCYGELTKQWAIPLPLYAIDFVQAHDGSYLAIDFNKAPGLQFTGLEKSIQGGEIVDLIESGMRKFGYIGHNEQ